MPGRNDRGLGLKFHGPGCSSRRDNIVRALKFIKIFYNLTPNGRDVTINQIREALDCSASNARKWRDGAGGVFPLIEMGTDEYRRDCAGGYAAITYGVMNENQN
jgi:hypothetical protein